jgi:hypothetical protein
MCVLVSMRMHTRDIASLCAHARAQVASLASLQAGSSSLSIPYRQIYCTPSGLAPTATSTKRVLWCENRAWMASVGTWCRKTKPRLKNRVRCCGRSARHDAAHAGSNHISLPQSDRRRHNVLRVCVERVPDGSWMLVPAAYASAQITESEIIARPQSSTHTHTCTHSDSLTQIRTHAEQTRTHPLKHTPSHARITNKRCQSMRSSSEARTVLHSAPPTSCVHTCRWARLSASSMARPSAQCP